MDLKAGPVTFALAATPREYREGMTAVFTATGAEFGAVEVPGTLEGGQSFGAELTCPLADDITLSVGFTTEGVTVNQELGQEMYLLDNTRLEFYGNLGWSMGGEPGEKMELYSLEANLDGIKPGQYKTPEGWQELGVEKGSLRLWINDTLFWSEERPEIAQGARLHDLFIPVEELELEQGDRVVLSVAYTDSAGREMEARLDGWRLNEEEKLEPLAPYEVTRIYPWE